MTIGGVPLVKEEPKKKLLEVAEAGAAEARKRLWQPKPPTIEEVAPTPKAQDLREQQLGDIETQYGEEKASIETEFAELIKGLPPEAEIERASEWEKYQSAKTWYEESLSAIEEWHTTSIAGVSVFFDLQDVIDADAQELTSLVSQEKLDAALALIPKYRSDLQAYKAILEKEPEAEGISEAIASVDEMLAGLADIEIHPERYMPKAAWEALPWWEKMGQAAYQATVGAPWYMKPLAPVTVPMSVLAPHPWIFEGLKTAEEYFAAILTTGIEEMWLTGLAPFSEEARREREELLRISPQETLERYHEYDYPWGIKGGLEILPWFLIPYGAIGRGVGGALKAARYMPEAIRFMPATVPLLRYGRLATRFPSVAAQLPRIANALKPVTPAMAVAMEPVALAARVALWGGGMTARAATLYVKGVLAPVIIAGRPVGKAIVRWRTLKPYNALAKEQGLRVIATKPTAEAPFAGYVIRGITPETKAIQVYARDLSEVGSYLDYGTLISKDAMGLMEPIYIVEYDTVLAKSMFEWGEFWPGAHMVESPLGTIYRTNVHPSLTVISQSQSLGYRPSWISKDVWAKAQEKFSEAGNEGVSFAKGFDEFLLATPEETIAQRFATGQARELGLAISKTGPGKAILERVNYSATADTLAKQAVVLHADSLVKGQSYKTWLMMRLYQHTSWLRPHRLPSEDIFGIRMKKVTVRAEPEVGRMKTIEIDAPFMTKVRVKSGQEGATMAMGDVAEAVPGAPTTPYLYTDAQAAYLRDLYSVYDDALAWVKRELRALGYSEGKIANLIKELPERDGWHYVSRGRVHVESKGELVYVGRRVGGEPAFLKTRLHESMQEGIETGVRYGANLEPHASTYIDGCIKLVADHRMRYVVDPLGKTVQQLVELRNPGLIQRWKDLRNTKSFLRGGNVEFTRAGVKVIRKVPGIKALVTKLEAGVPLSSATIRAMETRFPELGATLRQIVQISQPNLVKSLKAISKEQWQAAKITRVRFLEQLEAVRMERLSRGVKVGEKAVLPGELTATLNALNVETKLSSKMLEQIYTQAYKLQKAERQTLIQQLRTQIDDAVAQISDKGSVFEALQKEYKDAVAEAKRPFGKSWLDHPAFRGKLFDEEVVATITKAFKTETSAWVRASANMSSLMRTLVAALDFSAPFIHGLPVLGQDIANAMAGRPTFTWAKATGRHYYTFFNPKAHAKYLLENEKAVVELAKYGGYIGGSEFYEAMAMIQRVFQRLPGETGTVPLWVLKQTYGRAEAAFGAFGDIARIELWKALKLTVKPNELFELAASINKMTGVTSSQALGIASGWRQLESGWLFFAPRYTRACFALVADIMRGGIRGQLARRSLGGMMAGGVGFYVGTCWAIGQTPNLNPLKANFMCIKVGDDWIGIGGGFVGLLRFQANLLATTGEDPFWWSNWGNLTSRRENPFLKFMYNKSAQMTSLLVGLTTQKNFLGEPIETAGDYAGFLSSFITPIAMQGVVTEKDKVGMVAFMGDIMGLRTFPRSIWDHLKEMRESLVPFAPDLTAQQKTWDDLSTGQKDWLIDHYPELAALEAESLAQSLKRGDAFTKLYAEWEVEWDKIKVWRDGEYAVAIGQYENNMALKERWRAGDTTLTDDQLYAAENAGDIFREAISDIGSSVYQRRQQLETTGHFADIYSAFDEWATQHLESDIVEIVAYDDYINVMYEGQSFEDPDTGLPLWDEMDRVEQEYIDRWGQSVYDWVQEELARRRDEPPLIAELRAAKEYMKPYWEVADTLAATGKYPKDSEEQEQWIIAEMRKSDSYAADIYASMLRAFEEDRPLYDKYRSSEYMVTLFAWADRVRVPTVESMVDEERKKMRRGDPKLDAYLVQFYDRVPILEQVA